MISDELSWASNPECFDSGSTSGGDRSIDCMHWVWGLVRKPLERWLRIPHLIPMTNDPSSLLDVLALEVILEGIATHIARSIGFGE